MTEREVYALAAERGVSIERAGAGWRLSGPGVSVLVSDLRYVSQRDLQPAGKFTPTAGAAESGRAVGATAECVAIKNRAEPAACTSLQARAAGTPRLLFLRFAVSPSAS